MKYMHVLKMFFFYYIFALFCKISNKPPSGHKKIEQARGSLFETGSLLIKLGQWWRLIRNVGGLIRNWRLNRSFMVYLLLSFRSSLFLNIFHIWLLFLRTNDYSKIKVFSFVCMSLRQKWLIQPFLAKTARRNKFTPIYYMKLEQKIVFSSSFEL